MVLKYGSDSIESNPGEPKEVWISPTHWDNMDDEKKAYVVDIFHRFKSGASRFPFENMLKKTMKKTGPQADEETTVGYYDVGITFTVYTDTLRGQAMIKELEAFKIPNVIATFSDISKKQSIFFERGK